MLTAVIMTQTSVGKSLIATIDYMIGTLGGGIYSGLVGIFVPHNSNLEIMVALGLALAPLAFLASLSPRFAAAPFTAVMVYFCRRSRTQARCNRPSFASSKLQSGARYRLPSHFSFFRSGRTTSSTMARRKS
ncbi:MAG: FUSC family protein [Methylovirgula sp.]